MKKFEIPEINISMFDAAVATDGSAVGQAKQAIDALNENVVVDQAAWGASKDWTIAF